MCVTLAPAKLSGTTISPAPFPVALAAICTTATPPKACRFPAVVATAASLPQTLCRPRGTLARRTSHRSPGLDNCLAFPVFGKFESIESLESPSLGGARRGRKSD